jgi:hypothetical protein
VHFENSITRRKNLTQIYPNAEIMFGFPPCPCLRVLLSYPFFLAEELPAAQKFDQDATLKGRGKKQTRLTGKSDQGIKALPRPFSAGDCGDWRTSFFSSLSL